MSTQSQIIWIFGPSGAGKETIINRAVSCGKKWKFLIKKLNLCKNVVKSNESLKVGNQRNSDKIKKEVINLAQRPSVAILIKVQWSEIEQRCVPKEIKEAIPNGIHRIIMLWADPLKIVERLKDDPRPNRRVVSEGQAKEHLKTMLQYAIDLQKEGFEVMWIDSNDDKYNLLSRKKIKDLIKK